MEEDIKQAKATIRSHDNVLNSAMERAIKTTKSVDKNAAMEKAKAAKVGIDNVQEELEYLQKKLVKLVERKK